MENDSLAFCTVGHALRKDRSEQVHQSRGRQEPGRDSGLPEAASVLVELTGTLRILLSTVSLRSIPGEGV